jgi:serine/threonine-protein kinase HipA
MSLFVHLGSSRIGTLEQGTGTDYTFTYDTGVVDAAGAGTIVLSNSLPVRAETYDAIPTRTFFDGLLPEGARRDEIARELKVNSSDGYRLLGAIGRDCAGAVVILPEDEPLGDADGSVRWLKDEELAELVDRLVQRPLGISRDGPRKMRISLAGAQRKLTLIRSGSNQFGEPQADAPSTHLIKPQVSDEYPELAQNEMFCMRVAGCAGLDTAETSLETIAGRPTLISRRFDRSSDGMATTRLHQEDLCQALGVSTNLKYQEDGGPDMRMFCALLREIGRAVDVEKVVRATVCNYVLGNSDAHGKNFSILFAEQGRRLAPLYDLVSTAVYEDEDDSMGMSIGDQFDPETVTLADWMDMSKDCDLPAAGFLEIVRQTATRVGDCAASIATLARAEGWHAPVIDRVVDVAGRRRELVAEQIG